MSYDVLPDELAAHASHVRALTDRLAVGVTVTADNVRDASAEYQAMDEAIAQPFHTTERSFGATERSYLPTERMVGT